MQELDTNPPDNTAIDPFETWEGPTPQPAPRRIGSFRIVDPIAAGAMGQVFRALNEATGETVALKLIQRADGREITERDRTLFLREMSVQSRLNHPRIVSIVDFGSANGELFMAMEYVRTIDLFRELRNCDLRQQIRVVCGVGCYILAGLSYAHQKNIVHRDIKPSNILVYRNQLHKIGIKIADFGISKDMRSAGLSGMTSDGEMRGTPAFMSPEHLANSRDAGPASDVYSTAAVLYYFLSGCVPHQEDVGSSLRLAQIIEGGPIPLSSRRASLPTALCDVIDRALLPLSAGRFETAIEFNQALLDFTRKKKV
ncbi:MAG: serine/threonine protein kinase [Rubripirellula sp.]